MFTSIKRLFQVLACLVLLGGSALTALYNYIDTNDAVQARLKLSVEDAEQRVDKDASFLEKVGAVVGAWWESDELVAEAEQDRALSVESKKQREQRERERRFNDSQYSESDDYYGASH